MRNPALFVVLFFVVNLSIAQTTEHNHAHGREIVFPNVPGYLTLKCDFHIHTVFSDGNVWPTIRVEEALKDGLDAIAMTEHLEYQPHGEDIPHPDRNRSYEVAKQFATAFNLIVINGVEITRSMPPGHNNAIFVEDANKILVDDPIEAFREANRQGAFVFWNHANWVAQRLDGIARLEDMHRQLLEENLLHGIEVVNDLTYTDEGLDIALDEDLVIIGTSDIHGLIDWQYEVPNGGHRPITLVFAEERTEESLEEAVKAGRTVAWFNNTLIGRQEYLNPLLTSSLVVTKSEYYGTSSIADVTIENKSDATFLLENLTEFTFHKNADILSIPAHESVTFQIKTLEQIEQFQLTFKVLNAVTAPKEHPEITLDITMTNL